MSSQNQAPVRVVIADDSDTFREALAQVVAESPGFELVGAASSGCEAVHLVASLAPHLLLIDLRMAEMNGIETATRIHRQYPDVVVLVVTATMRASLAGLSVTVGDKRDLSPQWLVDFWKRYSQTR